MLLLMREESFPGKTFEEDEFLYWTSIVTPYSCYAQHVFCKRLIN